MDINEAEIAKDLSLLNQSLELIVKYFQEAWSLNAVLVYKDLPHTTTKKHYHIQDSYLFILKGGLSLSLGKKTIRLVENSFKFIPKNFYHSTKIDPEGCTFIVANQNGDFEEIFY